MTSLSDLYELNTKQYREAAERIGDPVHRLILLQMVRAWLDAAALPAPTQTTSRGTGAPARSETALPKALAAWRPGAYSVGMDRSSSPNGPDRPGSDRRSRA